MKDDIKNKRQGDNQFILSPQTPEEKEGKPNRTLPKQQKVTRALILQSHQIQKSLFDESSYLTEEDKKKEEQNKNQGIVVSSNLGKQISEYDFRAYILAAKLCLYDQSYIYHNEDILSGFEREEVDIKGIQAPKNGFHNGHINVTLNDLCRIGYGIPDNKTPTTSQRNNMRNAIKVVHSTPIRITYPNGDWKETTLVMMQDHDYREKDGAELYHLILNPIFTTQEKGYGTILRGATTKLSLYLISKGKTGKAAKNAVHYAFLELISIQKKKDSDNIWTITLESLLQHLSLQDYYKKNKKMVIQKLEDLFQTFFDLGYLMEVPKPTIPEDKIYYFKLKIE